MLHSEVSIPFDLWVNQNLTLGTEWNQQRMKDLASNTQTFMGGDIPGSTAPAAARTLRRRSSRCLPKTTWS
jgi:ferric enterobactin receptor